MPRNFYEIYDSNGICLYGDVCRLNPVKQFRNGKSHIGFVFNLDAHGENGSHWVAMMIDRTRGNIFYYDSTARRPHPDIHNFMTHMRTRIWKEEHVRMPIRINKLARQIGNNECGIFAMTFLVLLLEKPQWDFDEINEYIGTDDDMNLLRNIFYV